MGQYRVTILCDATVTLVIALSQTICRVCHGIPNLVASNIPAPPEGICLFARPGARGCTMARHKLTREHLDRFGFCRYPHATSPISRATQCGHLGC